MILVFPSIGPIRFLCARFEEFAAPADQKSVCLNLRESTGVTWLLQVLGPRESYPCPGKICNNGPRLRVLLIRFAVRATKVFCKFFEVLFLPREGVGNTTMRYLFIYQRRLSLSEIRFHSANIRPALQYAKETHDDERRTSQRRQLVVMDHAVDTNGDLIIMGTRPASKSGYLSKTGGGTRRIRTRKKDIDSSDTSYYCYSFFGSTGMKKRWFDLTGGILTW